MSYLTDEDLQDSLRGDATQSTFSHGSMPTGTWVAPLSPSPNVQAMLSYIQATSMLDPPQVLRHFDDRLEHHYYPKSLQRPVLNKSQYAEYLAVVTSLLSEFKPTIHELIEAQDTIIVHASLRGRTRSGAPYTNELITMAYFRPPEDSIPNDGIPKIIMMKEFLDSTIAKVFVRDERERQTNAGRHKG